MRRRDIGFIFLFLAGVFFLRKIPVDWFGSNVTPFLSAYESRALFWSVIISLICIFISIKKNLLKYGGFIEPRLRNFWMFLIPVLYPGLAFVSGFENSCFANLYALVISIFLILVLAYFEEIVFRGFIQGYILKNYPGKTYGQVCLLSAAIFSGVHLTNLQYGEVTGVLQQVVYAFFTGLLFSVLLIRTNSVWMLGLTHAVLNTLSYRCSGLPENTVSGQATGAESFSVSDIGNIAGVVLLLLPVLVIYYILLQSAGKRMENTVSTRGEL